MRFAHYFDCELTKPAQIATLDGNLYMEDKEDCFFVKITRNGIKFTNREIENLNVNGFSRRSDGAIINLVTGKAGVTSRVFVRLPMECYEKEGPLSITIRTGGTTMITIKTVVCSHRTDKIIDTMKEG